MRVAMHYSILVFLSIALLLGLGGCAHMPKPPSEEMRGQFGTIGIISSTFNPKIQFHPEFSKGRLSGVGKGVGIGTGAGALYGLSLMAHGGSCSGEACAVILVIAATSAAIGGVVGGVCGGIEGAVSAVPKGEFQRIETAIKNALDGICIQKTVAASVFKNSLDLPDHIFILLEQEDLVISAPYNLNLLRERGIHTVLELNVKGRGFKGGKGKNPFIAFFMKVDTIRTMDGKEIYSREFEYKSSNHSSADWFDTDARLSETKLIIALGSFPNKLWKNYLAKTLVKYSGLSNFLSNKWRMTLCKSNLSHRMNRTEADCEALSNGKILHVRSRHRS